MPIISKETWDNLIPEEEKERIKFEFDIDVEDEYDRGYRNALKEVFGKENLQSKPLTYEDVARELFTKETYCWDFNGNVICIGSISSKCSDKLIEPNNCTSHKQAEKLLAINKLLNVCAWADLRNELTIKISAELTEKINGILTDREIELIISNDY